MSVCAGPGVVTNGLVFEVDAGNTKSYPGSGTTWTDLLGLATLTSTGTASYSSGAMDFAGGYARNDIGANALLDTQTPSMEIWVKAANFTQDKVLFERGSLNTQYSIIPWGGLFYWQVVRSPGGVSQTTFPMSGNVTNGTWIHLLGTFTSGSQNFYLNGALKTTGTNTGTLATGQTGVTVGAAGGGSYPYTCSVAVARIYNRALTAAEVAQNFNALRGRFGV